MLQILTALFALVGTAVQAYQSVRQIKTVDPSGHRSFEDIDHLSTEFKATRNPLLWARRKRDMRLLKLESPVEAQQHRRIWWQLMSWVLLACASGFGLCAAVLG